MKIAPFDDLYPVRVSTGGTIISGSSGSNSAIYQDMLGAIASNASVSYGSNSSTIAEIAAAGVLTSVARSDHYHDGIGTITASSSNTMQRGTLNLRPGSNVSFGLTDSDGDGEADTLTINGAAGGGGGTALTIEEVDGSPTVAATKLVLPNGTLGVVGTVATYTPAAGGGLTVQYPSLKPATPTYDFAGASLDGAFSAHSTAGSFVTGNCMTQGAAPWPGSTLEMQFSAQMGRLTLTHADADLDFTWGGVALEIQDPTSAIAIGIAALNSSGNGIIVVQETGNFYFGKVVTYQFTTVLASWAANTGPLTTGLMRSGAFWLRLKRVSGTWTGYASVSGRAWDKTFATDATAYTVDRLGFGMFYNTATNYNGRVLSDYIQVDV